MTERTEYISAYTLNITANTYAILHHRSGIRSHKGVRMSIVSTTAIPTEMPEIRGKYK